MTAPDSTIPDPPICKTADESKPCPYAQHCVEGRQRIQSGYRRVESRGRWVLLNPPMWGGDCWAYQQFLEKRALASSEPITIAPEPRQPGEEPF